jgi:hypothetical protein
MPYLQLLRQHHDAEWFVLSGRELREHERVQLSQFVWDGRLVRRRAKLGMNRIRAWLQP